jgi:hypothetical protein
LVLLNPVISIYLQFSQNYLNNLSVLQTARNSECIVGCPHLVIAAIFFLHFTLNTQTPEFVTTSKTPSLTLLLPKATTTSSFNAVIQQ